MNETHPLSADHVTPTSQSGKKARRRISPFKLFFLFIFLALCVGFMITGYLYVQARQKLMLFTTPQGQQQLSAEEVKIVQSQLSKLTLLPDESPVVATITDASYLATQSAFYLESQNGDKVVAYEKAQKVFIFSPSRNLIVNSGPLNNQSSDQSLTVEVRNGSTIAGLGDTVKADLISQGATVTKVTNASRRTYENTLVIGMSEKAQASVVQRVATFLKGDVSARIPTGEAESDADILVILGEASAATTPLVPPSPTTTQVSPSNALPTPGVSPEP